MAGEAEPRYLSTAQAAAVLGVSVSSVKRWVDEEILPAHKTAGGHRKLLRAEILALARQGDLPRADLAGLAVPAPERLAADPGQVAEALHAALIRGEGDEASAWLRRAYHAGVPIEVLADRVVAPAMSRVGHDWETARIDVWNEHRGTQLCVSGLHLLREELRARAERDRPLALGGAPEGDPYRLPSLLAEMVLLDNGWRAVDLGPNTPLPSLAAAVRELRPRLVWLSVSYLRDETAFVDAYREFYRTAERQGAAVAVGGQALGDPIRATIPYTTHGDGLGHLVAFARTLHPRPRRPERGRPPAAAEECGDDGRG